MIEWLGEARHFTHQQRLTLQVATLLGAEKLTTSIAKAPINPTPRSWPVIPVVAALDKVDLALTPWSELKVPATSRIRFQGLAVAVPPARPRVPPSEPPRAA